MKKIYSILAVAVLLFCFTSCGHSPYKKHKSCKGNGSWYGKRNLGYMVPLPDEKPDRKTYYVNSESNIAKERL